MTDKAAERAAILHVSPEALGQLFQLPAGAYVDGIVNDDRLGVFKLRVRGAGWPVKPGDIIPQASAVCTQTYDAEGAKTSLSIDWGFPK